MRKRFCSNVNSTFWLGPMAGMLFGYTFITSNINLVHCTALAEEKD